MIRRLAFAMVVVCSFLPAFAAASGERPKPELVLEESEGGTRILVELTGPDGSSQQHLLRQSSAAVTRGTTGWDPTGRSAFATWNEGAERFAAFSRDGGVTWADARPVKTTIHLVRGIVDTADSMPASPAGLQASRSDNLYLVHFVATGLPEWRQALTGGGAKILAHIPHNTQIVRMPQAALAFVRGLDFVERVEAYEPGFRLADDVLAWLEGDAPGESLRDLRLMVFEWGPEAKARLARSARALGAEILKNTQSGHIVEMRLGREQLRQLAHHDDLMWADFWTPAETDMDLVREDAGSNYIEDNFGYCGDGVRGEVMDNGIQEDHMDFDGILLHTGHDTQSHGTSTYGIVFGNGDRDGDGQAKGLGHMPCAQGIFADYGNSGDRFAHTEELKHSPYFASFQTNSWGDSRTRAYTSVSHEMDDIIWRLDIAILQSQSNAGNQDSRPQAWAKNIISVGGVKHKDTLDVSDDEWASGGSIGPAADGRIKPDINYWYDHIYTTTTGNGYTSSFGGTSGATPECAGVVGLMVQLWSENVWGTDPVGTTVFERQPHAATIKALAINNAQQYSFSGEGHDLTRVHQGWGRPSARLAKDRAEQSMIIDETQALAFDETVSYDVAVQEGESELKVTMIYPDPPGTTSASLHRINDLDLKVSSPSGTVYWGNNGLKAGNYSTPGGVPNELDTVENVFVQGPEAGTWKVEVHAAEINQDAYLDTPGDDAVFALVVTGGGGSICIGPDSSFVATPNPAQIGEEVLFDSTVSGGAGGPYTYTWDFDDDGVVDSTEEDPLHVYNFAYDGLVRLSARDAEGCPTVVENTMTVTGPDIRYHDYVSLTEIEGNGNGAIDPGETWEVTVDLRNDGNDTAVNVAAELAVDSLTAGPVVMVSSSANYGDMAPASIVPGAPAYRFRVGSTFPCGNNIHFDLLNIRSTTPDVVYPPASDAFKLLVGGSGPRQEIWSDGFETSSGWTGNGEWQRQAPQGLGAGSSIPGHTTNPDPESAREGSSVAGTDLSGLGIQQGNYEDNSSSAYTSPSLDFSDAILVELEFYRWLNAIPQDRAAFEVTTADGAWVPLYETTDGATDDVWTAMTFNLEDYADRNPNFRMRFSLISDENAGASGWNVDDMRIMAVTKDSCEPFGQGAPGVSDGLMLTRESSGELTLSWQADCGTGSAYGIYRGDLLAGYSSLAPEPGMCDVAATEATIPAGEGSADFFLVVPNDSGSEGGYGSDSASSRRTQATGACYPQDALDTCVP